VTLRGFATALLAAGLLATAGLAPAGAAAAPAPAAKKTVPAKKSVPAKSAAPAAPNPATVASEARTQEDAGVYGLALERLRALRALVPPDGDLELAVAIDEARANLLDSAWVRLQGPVLAAALADTGGPERRRDYPFQREPFWLNGRFDGWYWYVARARAEVAMRLGRWGEALAAARVCAAARPMAGKEHLLLALCSARTGDATTAKREADRAAALDPTLPEARYLAGVLAWREGGRLGAKRAFREALDLDSTYRAPALALARLLLPGVAPDTLPVRFLTGPRRAGELTSRARPKLEEYVQFDQLAALFGQPSRTVPDSLKQAMGMTRETRLYINVLVDEGGRVVMNDLPWMPEGLMPETLIADILRESRRWNFRPAIKLGKPRASYATVEYQLNP
jgi:tetratricopeptide (TPR) repeat protein